MLDPTDDNRLTLTTCHPRFSAAQRLIVVAKLIGEAALRRRRPRPAAKPRTSRTPAGRRPGSRATDAGKRPAVLWGLAARPSCGWPRLAVAPSVAQVAGLPLAATPVFLVVLFVFFENFARLLPANV